MQRWRRFFRHHWLDERDSRRALAPAAARRLAERIAASERRHGGEIRICVEAALPAGMIWPPPAEAAMPGLLRRRALEWFGRLGVWDTRHNNGVLVYLLLAERAIEIVADRGLNEAIGAEHWQAHLERLGEALQRGEFEQGLLAVVDEVGALLERHFPAEPGRPNPNELPDAVLLC
jgi:uncharacterized membrane protein